eukprot:6195608-Pleurochrysis_carterae.AAC.2
MPASRHQNTHPGARLHRVRVGMVSMVNGSIFGQSFSMPTLRLIITGGTICGLHQNGAPLRPWRY